MDSPRSRNKSGISGTDENHPNKASFHRPSHTLAPRLLNAGMDITRIQKLLGHVHLDTTLIYARALDTTVEADYRQAMSQIEHRQMPLSDTPIPADSWPTQAAPGSG